MEKNWSYKITDTNHPKCGTVLWSGRYVAVTGIVFRIVNNETYVLANLRGKGTPDFQGYWNMPCGYLEANETGEEGTAREIYEECGYNIPPNRLMFLDVETDPVKSNNGNVTLRYCSIEFAKELPELKYENINGEKDEVASVKWINIKELYNYKWAFNHKELIKTSWYKLTELNNCRVIPYFE